MHLKPVQADKPTVPWFQELSQDWKLLEVAKELPMPLWSVTLFEEGCPCYLMQVGGLRF